MQSHPTSQVQKNITSELGINNIHALPSITKVVINTGIGKARSDEKYIQTVERELMKISGQKPRPRSAKRAVAGFGVRAGNKIGYQITLRGKRAYDFMQRFVHFTLPRIRDFRGVPVTSLDGKGNLSIGVPEQLSFPEIHTEEVDIIFGVEVTFVTSANTNQEAEVLFRSLGFPLRASDLDFDK